MGVKMTVTVEDVRFFLKNLPEDFVSDETVEIQIDLSSWEISKEAGSGASAEDIDKCVLLRSAYYTTLAYLQEAERALGVVPPGLAALVAELKQRMENCLKILIKISAYPEDISVYPISVSLATLTDSMWDYRSANVLKTCTAHNNHN